MAYYRTNKRNIQPSTRGGNGRDGDCQNAYGNCCSPANPGYDSPWGPYCQSTSQHFYFMNPLIWQDGTIANNVWVGAFSPSSGVCVGSRLNDISTCGGGMCDVPAMGTMSCYPPSLCDDDGTHIFTDGYMEIGEIPILKAYFEGQEFDIELGETGTAAGPFAGGLEWTNGGLTNMECIIQHTIPGRRMKEKVFKSGGVTHKLRRGGRTNTNSRFSGRTQTNLKGKPKK